MKEQTIYFDNSRVTQPSHSVIAKMHALNKEHWQNLLPAPYEKSNQPFELIRKSKETIQEFLGAPKKSPFYLTSSAAEGFSQVLQGVCLGPISESGKNHIIQAAIDDPLILNRIERWEPLGVKVIEAPLNSDGQVTCDTLNRVLSPRTALLTLPWANGLTGVMHPIWEIANLCEEKGILFHVDASAILGKYYFSFSDIPIDFLTFDGSLIHGPTCNGGLLIREPDTLSFPSKDFEGRENLPVLAGLATACEEAEAHFDHLCLETARLRNKLEAQIKTGFSQAEVLFQSVERLPNVSCIAFPGVFHELLAFILSEQGIAVSFGGGNFPSLESMLTKMGIKKALSESALSFSLSRYTTEEEIDRVSAAIVETAQRCQTFSQRVSL